MLTNQALEIMHRNPDLINIRNSWGNKVPVWNPIFSQERAQPLGVSRQGMAQSIQIGSQRYAFGRISRRRPSIAYTLERQQCRFVHDKRSAHLARIWYRSGNNQLGTGGF